MRLRRHIIALYLLGTFAIGGVLAPASHMLYMAFGDAYAPMRHLHAGGHDMASHPEHAAWVGDTVDVEPCQYVSLYETFVLSSPRQHIDAAPAPCVVSISVLEQQVLAAQASTHFLVRGPPIA
jgi:hypothetical protein